MSYFNSSYKSRSFPPLGLTSKMPFGKYKGDRLIDIKEKDPSYINWLTDTDIKLKPEVNYIKIDYEDMDYNLVNSYDKVIHTSDIGIFNKENYI